MSTDYDTIRKVVIKKVRDMCFMGVFISDDDIGKIRVCDLHLFQGSHIPGTSPYDGLALRIRTCGEIDLPGLTGHKIKQIEILQVDNIAKYIYSELMNKNGMA